VQYRAELRIHRDEVSKLLDQEQALANCVWPVNSCYRIAGGWIYSDGDDWTITRPLADPDLFLSFARLWTHGEPSNNSILRWISKHGLLGLKEGHLLWTINQRGETEITQAHMIRDDFTAEALCAHQLLHLYTDIKSGNLDAIKARFDGRYKQQESLKWGRILPDTVVDKLLQAHANLAKNGHSHFQPNQWVLKNRGQWNEEDYRDVYSAADALQVYVGWRLDNIKLNLSPGNLFTSPLPLGATYRPDLRWYCADLLSAIYVQFALLISDQRPMRRCENPVCELPFPATRKNKRFCNATCRSNARHYR
jgi:hypothetical protein